MTVSAPDVSSVVRLVAQVIVQLESDLAQERERRMSAEAMLEQEYREEVLREARRAEWEPPPVCGCGRIGYEVYCRCGKRLQ